MSKIANSRGLSALQRRIIAAIANHTVNSCDYDDLKKQWMNYRAVRELVLESDGVGYGGAPGYRTSKRVTFSRAVHSLIRRKLVEGLALGWVLVPHDELLQWQGGGRLPSGYDNSRPKIKMLSLTKEGWATARPTETAAEIGG